MNLWTVYLVVLNLFKGQIVIQNEDGTIETVTNSYFIGEKLHKTKSKKDYIVSQLLETYDKRTLIYTFDNSVAKRIAESTEAVFVDTSKRETAEAEIQRKTRTKCRCYQYQ